MGARRSRRGKPSNGERGKGPSNKPDKPRQEKGEREESLGMALERGERLGVLSSADSWSRALPREGRFAQPGGGQGQDHTRPQEGQEPCGAVALCFRYLTRNFPFSPSETALAACIHTPLFIRWVRQAREIISLELAVFSCPTRVSLIYG
jgi:hypothetical protein